MESAYIGRSGTVAFKIADKTRIMLRGAGGLLDLSTSGLMVLPHGCLEPGLKRLRIRHFENLLFMAGNQLEVHYLDEMDKVKGIRTLFGVRPTLANDDGSFDISYEDEVMEQGEVIAWDTREEDPSPCGGMEDTADLSPAA